jgi:hypothetical protein
MKYVTASLFDHSLFQDKIDQASITILHNLVIQVQLVTMFPSLTLTIYFRVKLEILYNLKRQSR